MSHVREKGPLEVGHRDGPHKFSVKLGSQRRGIWERRGDYGLGRWHALPVGTNVPTRLNKKNALPHKIKLHFK